MTSSQEKIKSFLIEKLNNIGFSPMKEALMHGFEETIAKAFRVDFHSANTRVMSAFFCYLKMTMLKMIYQGTLDFIMTKSFNRLLQ